MAVQEDLEEEKREEEELKRKTGAKRKKINWGLIAIEMNKIRIHHVAERCHKSTHETQWLSTLVAFLTASLPEIVQRKYQYLKKREKDF